MALSAEAQHLINALEAHFAALRAHVVDASQMAIEHVESAWDDAREAIRSFRLKLDAEIGGQPSTGGASAAVNSAAETAPAVGAGVLETAEKAAAPEAASPAPNVPSLGEDTGEATPGAAAEKSVTAASDSP